MNGPRRQAGRQGAACIAVLAGIAAAMLAGCGGGATTATSTSNPVTTPSSVVTPSKAADGLVWVLSSGALRKLAVDPTALGVVTAGKIYELVTRKSPAVPGVAAILTEDFDSYGALAGAVSSGAITPGVKALLYDPEHWSFTPAAEQADVGAYATEAIALAHAHGLQLIVTPALDLVSSTAPGSGPGGRVGAFLAAGIDASVAGADVIDIQAQNTEQDTADYESFVKAATAQIHARNPHAVVIAGLTTNKGTAALLEAAIRSVTGVVAGYWVNIPAEHGASCPSCGPPNPAIAIAALDAVFG